MEGVNSFRAAIRMEGFAVQQPLTVTTEVAQQNVGRKRSLVTVETFGGRQEVEVVTAEPYTYVNLPDRGWLRVSGEDNRLAQALQIGSTGFFDTFPSNVVPWGLYTVLPLGGETVDGVETEHFSVEVDLREAIGRSDKEVRQQLVQNLAPPSLVRRTTDLESLAAEIEVRRLEVWIDSLGYHRRMVMDVVIGDLMDVEITVRAYDLNQEIRIEPPADFTELPVVTGPGPGGECPPSPPGIGLLPPSSCE